MADEPGAPVDGGERRTGEQPRTAATRSNDELRAALAEQTALLHELDHRVKNTFQVITSLVQLKSRRTKDPAARRALVNMAEHVSALSTVHRLLQPERGGIWFNVAEFVTDLTQDLMVPFQPGTIDLSLDLQPVVVAGAKAAPLALVVNELVGNALKHAFAEGRGRLSVSVRLNEEGMRIIVADNGIGLAAHPPAAEGFGKTLIAMLTRQLRATMAWEDAQPGTRAVLAVPLEDNEVRAAAPAAKVSPAA